MGGVPNMPLVPHTVISFGRRTRYDAHSVSIDLAFVDLAIAAGLGLLVGLQRESASSRVAGLRTFTLVTLLGAMCAQLAPALGPYFLPAATLGVAILAAVSHYTSSSSGESAGLTTEVALVAMFLVGASVVAGDVRYAVVTGAGIAVLLHSKRRFRGIMEKLGETDVRAIMQFALISLVILPILPDDPFGPWGVLNLFEMWLLVVLIVGINLIGYIVYKFFGARAGTFLGGVLGGVISSTATTVSYARTTKTAASSASMSAVVIMVATAVVLVRVAIEMAVVARPLLAVAAWPFGILFAVATLLSVAVWWRSRGGVQPMPEQENPTTMKAALLFACLYAAVLVAVAWARENLTSAGLYAVALLSGLTDVDAITLSTAGLAGRGQLGHGQAWRVIMLAFLANLAFKVGIVAFAGARALLVRVAVLFGTLFAAGGALILFWP